MEKYMNFVADVAVNLVADATARTLRSFFREDMTAEYKQRLTGKIRLARAIVDQVPKPRTIKNKHLKAWRLDLIAAAKRGSNILQSSTADSKALKSALSDLENLTSEANLYLKLFKLAKKEALDSAASAGIPEMPLSVVPVKVRSRKQRLADMIHLARAIINQVPKPRAIKNKHLKAWQLDLTAAANRGRNALQSSTTDTNALKSILSDLENLTSEANLYLRLVKKEALNSAASGNPLTPLSIVHVEVWSQKHESLAGTESG